MAQAGASTAAIANFLALILLPQIAKIAWAPLLDATLGPKRWYLISLITIVAMLVALAILPLHGTPSFGIAMIALACSVASATLAIVAETIIAYDVVETRKGAAAGWFQAANTGGVGLGGGLALSLSQHVQMPAAPALAVGAICAMCIVFLALVADRPSALVRTSFAESGRALVADLWHFVRSRGGATVVLLMMLPIGSGAAASLWGPLAREWRADADMVAIAQGVPAGLASLVGAVAAGWVCDRIDRKTAYCLFGGALALIALAIAFGPRTPTAFVTGALVYAFVGGASFASFSAVVLEVVGEGAAATKITLLTCLSNLPITLLIQAEGHWYDRWGSVAMLGGEVAAYVISLLVLGAGLLVLRQFMGRASAARIDNERLAV